MKSTSISTTRCTRESKSSSRASRLSYNTYSVEEPDEDISNVAKKDGAGSKAPIGEIVGGVIGGLAIIGIAVLAVLLLLRKRRRQQANNNRVEQFLDPIDPNVSASALIPYPTDKYESRSSFSLNPQSTLTPNRLPSTHASATPSRSDPDEVRSNTSCEISDMRTEMAQLRAQIDSMRAPPAYAS